MRRLVVALLIVVGCGRERHVGAVPPAAEFLVATADSTFWVRADSDGVKLRAAPLILARVGDRFVELYVADEDRSFDNAVFVGQRVYTRDLERGDSNAVYRDLTVLPMAMEWSRTHPSDPPLAPDDPEPEHPETRATVEIGILDVMGRWLSIEIHSDLTPRGADLTHESRRAVLDLQSGRVAPLAAIVPGRDTGRILGQARAALATARAAAEALHDDRGPAARRALGALSVNPSSFSLMPVAGEPAVQFLASVGRPTDDGTALPLTPQPLGAPSWFSGEVRDAVASSSADIGGGRSAERWTRPRYELLARADTGSDAVQLALRDTARREFAIGAVQGSVRRVYWLDAIAFDATARRALNRAFDDATYYSEQTRTVRAPRGTPLPRMRLAARSRATDACPSRSGAARGHRLPSRSPRA